MAGMTKTERDELRRLTRQRHIALLATLVFTAPPVNQPPEAAIGAWGDITDDLDWEI